MAIYFLVKWIFLAVRKLYYKQVAIRYLALVRVYLREAAVVPESQMALRYYYTSTALYLCKANLKPVDIGITEELTQFISETIRVNEEAVASRNNAFTNVDFAEILEEAQNLKV